MKGIRIREENTVRGVDMYLLKGVIKKSIFIILPAIVISAFLTEPQKMPLGILTGWVFGLFNLKQLTKNVKRLAGAERAAGKLVVLSMIRLAALFFAIFLLVYYDLINVLGLLLGFTVVFVFILIEGARAGTGAKQDTGCKVKN